MVIIIITVLNRCHTPPVGLFNKLSYLNGYVNLTGDTRSR
jgi:hypothetical protein